jgi:hypothetical protein
MRRRLTFAVCLLILSVLACNVPRPGGVDVPPTDLPAVTKLTATKVYPTEPPPTEPPTAEGPTATPTGEVPTSTPVSEETSPTMTPSSTPAILSFTSDRTTIVQGESVDLTWWATGGTEAHICWVTHEAIMACVPGPVDPDGGTETVMPTAPGRPGVADIVLTVKNSAGAAEAHVDVTIACVEDPLPTLEDQQLFGNCPYGTVVGNAAYQAFGGGYMIWLEGSSTIYVLYADGRYESYADNFREGDPESDPSIVPPEGLLQPVRGFGLVWRTYPAVRDGLGWALAPEEGFQGWSQSYSGSGMHNSGTFLRFIDGSVVLLSHFGATWRFVTP